MGLGYFSLHLIVTWGLISLGGGSDMQVEREACHGQPWEAGALPHLLCLLLLLPPLHFFQLLSA